MLILILISGCFKKETENDSNEESQPNETITDQDDNNTNNSDLEGKEEIEEEPTNFTSNLLEIAPKIPETLEEIAEYPTGPLAGNGESNGGRKLTKEELAESVMAILPEVDDDADEGLLDEWSRAYYYLFHEDYPDPRDIITQTKLDHFGNPGIDDERFHFKDQMNVLVILDVSGSMANEINGKSMMDIAKDSIREFTSDLPEEANIGLRVYGHEGARTGKTKEESCQITDLVYDIQPLDKQEFQGIVDSFEPTGWTPIGLSLEKAKDDFKDFPGEENTNLVYVVSDGAETCGGDPVKAAKELTDSNIQPIINVIGFNVDIEGQSHLREIADAGGGIYTNAGDEEQLKEAFDQAEEMLKMWEEWKKGVRKDAFEERTKQRVQTFKLFDKWIHLQMNEYTVKHLVSGILRRQGYITQTLKDRLDEDRKKQQNLYSKVNRETRSTLVEEIDQNYEKLMQQIEEAYEENVN